MSGGWLGAELRLEPKDWTMCSKLVYNSKLNSQHNRVGTYVAFLYCSVSVDVDNDSRSAPVCSESTWHLQIHLQMHRNSNLVNPISIRKQTTKSNQIRPIYFMIVGLHVNILFMIKGNIQCSLNGHIGPSKYIDYHVDY